MPSIDHVASALFKTLTSEQLRDLLAAYIGIDKSAQLTQKTREQIIGHLEAGSNPNLLATLAHRIEMVSPYKHCVPFSSEPAKVWTYHKLRDTFQRNLPGLADTFVPLNSASFGLEIQMYLIDKENERIFLKFSHMVDVWETVIKTDKERSTKSVPARHIVVAQFYPKINLVTISFPGFTQQLAGGDRYAYINYASEAAQLIADRLGVELQPVNLKIAADGVTNDRNSEVIDIRRTMQLSGVSVAAKSKGEVDLANAITAALKLDGNITLDVSKLKSLFDRSPADDIFLFWQRSGVTTRIALKKSPHEILFVWSKAQASLAIVEDVINTLARYQEIGSHTKLQEALMYLEECAEGVVVQPYFLTQKFSLDLDQALQLLFQMSKNGIFEARYRIETDEPLSDYDNIWVDSLLKIPAAATTTSGNKRSRTPSDIEVGFERVRP